MKDFLSAPGGFSSFNVFWKRKQQRAEQLADWIRGERSDMRAWPGQASCREEEEQPAASVFCSHNWSQSDSIFERNLLLEMKQSHLLLPLIKTSANSYLKTFGLTGLALRIWIFQQKKICNLKKKYNWKIFPCISNFSSLNSPLFC